MDNTMNDVERLKQLGFRLALAPALEASEKSLKLYQLGIIKEDELVVWLNTIRTNMGLESLEKKTLLKQLRDKCQVA